MEIISLNINDYDSLTIYYNVRRVDFRSDDTIKKSGFAAIFFMGPLVLLAMHFYFDKWDSRVERQILCFYLPVDPNFSRFPLGGSS